jgi:hypothetical protein
LNRSGNEKSQIDQNEDAEEYEINVIVLNVGLAELIGAHREQFSPNGFGSRFRLWWNQPPIDTKMQKIYLLTYFLSMKLDYT